MTCGSCDARTAMGVRARLGASPRAARNWGLVRPLLPAWPGAPAVVFLAFLTRPTGGIAGEWPYTSPSGHPRHHVTSSGTEARPRGHPPATRKPLKGAWGRNPPNCVPIPPHLHTITSRHPLAPPARAARSRRPLAPPVRAARSRRPLAPSAHAATSLHRHHSLIMVRLDLDLPIPSHLHTITSRHPFAPPARAARLRRPLAPPARAAHSRRPLAPSARAARPPPLRQQTPGPKGTHPLNR